MELSDFRPELQDALEIARLAGKTILPFFRSQFAVTQKANATPVTEADHAADRLILRELKRRYSYPILSEESEDDPSRFGNEYLWVVDPLDGTVGFIKGEDTFTVLIGLCQKDEPILGVVHFPATGLTYFAEKGKGAYEVRPGAAAVKIHASKAAVLAGTTTLWSNKSEGPVPAFQSTGVKNILRMGGFGAKAIAVATGAADFYVNTSTKGSEWDSCAPEAILAEAGGVMTDLAGERFLYNQKDVRRQNGTLVSGNPVLHKAILSALVPEILKTHAPSPQA